MTTKTLARSTALILLSLLIQRAATAQTYPQEKLVPADSRERLWFGYSVDIHGDLAAIGATNIDDNGIQSGGAYVYRYDGSAWREDTKLIASDGAKQDTMGNSVAVHENTIIVGAYQSGGNGNAGAAYIYEASGGSWSETKLTASDPISYNFFGCSVALEGDTAVVGAFQHGHSSSQAGAGAGAAYVFQKVGATWTETAELLPSDGSTTIRQRFGSALALSGDTLIVGSPLDDDKGSLTGSAYIYRYDGADWNETAKLLPSDNPVEDSFGYSVAIDGNVAVVGAYRTEFSYGETVTGAAYVFEFDGNEWNEMAKFTSGTPGKFTGFGRSVAVEGDTVLVSEFLAGTAHMYLRNEGGWSEAGTVWTTDDHSGDVHAASLAIDGDHLISGSYSDGREQTLAGSAYITTIPEPSTASMALLGLLSVAVLRRRGSPRRG